MTQDPGDRLLEQHAFVQRLAQALLKDRDLAADVAQDAMVAAIERPPAVATPMHLRAWLRTVVRRIALAARTDRAERARRERRVARPEGNDAERAAGEQLALHRDLTAAVHALREPYRTAVTLCYLADQKPAATAQQSGVTSAVVRQRIHRGLAMLRERLDREHGSRAAWAGPLAATLPEPSFLVLLATLAMNKTALAAAAVLAVVATGTWFTLQPGAPLLRTTDAAATPAAAVADRGAVEPGTGPVAPTVPPDRATERTSAEFTVAVVDARGDAVEHAEVHCCPGDGESVRHTTGADGCAAFPASDMAGAVVVCARARFPQVVRLPALRGEQRVVLADGRRVAGQVFVDGAPAGAGLALRLHTFRDDVDDLPAAVADLVRADVDAATDGNGRFAFTGLADVWQGMLQLPLANTHWLLPRPDQQRRDSVHLLLPQPIEDLVLATTALPCLHARIVWADDGTPVGGADLGAVGYFADQTNSPGIGLATDADGRFTVGFQPMTDDQVEPARRSPVVRVSLHAEAEGTSHEFELEGPLPSDCVTLRMPRVAPTFFRTIDRDGQPVAGARVLTIGLSEPTGPDGRGIFLGERERARIGAKGYQVAPFPASTAAGTSDDPVIIALERSAELRIRARDARGGRPPFERVEIDTDGACFAGRPMPGELLYAFGNTRLTGGHHTPGGAAHCIFTTDPQGDVTLYSLDPGHKLTIRLCDELWAEVVRAEVTTPPVGERLEVDLAVTAAERQVRGRVFTAATRPLAGAMVCVTTEGVAFGPASAALSPPDGSFTCRGIASTGPLAVTATCKGFATQRRTVHPVDGPLTFVLEPARSITVRIVGDGGEAVPLEPVLVRGAGGQPVAAGQTTSTAPGEFAVDDLPQQDLVFACTVGGREFTCTAPAGASAAVLRVPTMARVTFAPPPPGFAPPQHGFFDVRGQSLEPHGEPFRLNLDADEPPALLPPGRYRFVLQRCGWDELAKQYVEAELPAAAELDLIAGATANVALR